MKAIQKLKTKYTNMSDVAKATLWFMVCSILQRGLSLLTTPIFTRLMTTEQYGMVNVFNSWKQIVLIVCTFCLDYGVFYKGISRFENDKDGYTVSMQTFSSVLTAAVTVLYLIFRTQINNFTELSTLLTLVMLVETHATFSISYWSIRKKYDYEYKKIVALTFGMSVANVLLSVFAVVVSEHKDVARIMAAALAQCIFGLAIYYINIKNSKKLIVSEYVKYAVLFNLPLMPHYFATYILEQSDRIMVQKMIGLSEAGLYSVAYNVAATIKIISNSINNSLIPWEYKKLKEKDTASLNKQFSSFMLLYTVLTILFIALAPEAVAILAGDKYNEAIYCIPPVAASCFFTFVFGVYGNAEFFFDANKFTMYISIFGAALNLVLNYIFIPILGYIAAAYTTLFCYIVFSIAHFIFVNFISKKKIGIYAFDAKSLFSFSFIIIATSIVMTFLYDKLILRYMVILVILLVAYIKREDVKKLLRKV